MSAVDPIHSTLNSQSYHELVVNMRYSMSRGEFGALAPVVFKLLGSCGTQPTGSARGRHSKLYLKCAASDNFHQPLALLSGVERTKLVTVECDWVDPLAHCSLDCCLPWRTQNPTDNDLRRFLTANCDKKIANPSLPHTAYLLIRIHHSMYVIEIFADNEGQEGAQVTLLLERTGQRVAISLFRSDKIENQTKGNCEEVLLVDHLIKLLAQSLNTEDEDEERALEDEAMDPICDAATSLDLEGTLARDSSQATQELTLHDLLFPQTSHFRLEAVAKRLTLIPISASDAYGRTYSDDDNNNSHKLGEDGEEINLDASLPNYSSEKIKVLEQFVRGAGTVCLVQVDGRRMLCKARYDGLRDYNIQREIECLQKVSQAFPGGAQRPYIPTLLGYVTHPRSGVVLGFLREWLSSKDSLEDLNRSGFPGLQKDTREKWGRQIKETVDSLHKVDIVWGDAKPSNVVIDDLNNDAWLIDFGGGWTEGWVDKNLQNTKAGDQQAVERMLKFLDVDI